MNRDLDALSKRLGTVLETKQANPMTAPKPNAWRDQRHKGIPGQQTLKKAVAVIRSKSKTRQLVALCELVTSSAHQSPDWFAKYQRFFRSPVWKLVSDEAIRKAHFKCECWGCPGRARQVHLLEFPEEHLEPNFDWMNRNDILIALCSHHYEIMHRFVMKKVVPLDHPVDTGMPVCLPGVRAHGARV